MAADNKLLFEVIVDDKGGVVKLKSLDKGIKDIDLSSKSATNAARQLTKQIQSVGGGVSVKNIKLTKNELDELQKSMTHTKTATGNFSSAALEAGRIVSDMPYGIRGVANNLSQFATNMMFAAKQAGGLTAAVKGLWSALKGPLGILLAIQAVIAAVDYFSSAQSRAKKATDELTDSIDDQITKLNVLASVLQESESDFINQILGENWKDDLKVFNNEFGEFRKKYESLSKEQQDDKALVLEMIADYKELLIVRSQIQKTQEELNELEKKGVEQGRIENLKNEMLLLFRQKASLEEIFKIEKERGRAKEKERQKQRDKDPKFSGQDDLPDDSWIKRYAKWYKWYVEQKRRIEAEIEIASMEEKGMDILNENEYLSHERDILDAKFLEDVKRIEDEIELRKLANLQYEDLERKKTLIAHKYSMAQKDIDQDLLDNKVETMGMIGNALGTFADLAGENTAAGKALAVASATIDTWAAATAALNDKTVPSTLARVALMSSIIATGLANVKQILSVKIPNQSSSGGGSGQVPAGREFDFNLVGSTGQDQLAQTIGGQVQQPIRAYVVSSEITNQQAFDNQIQGSATIGIGGD